MTGNKLVVVLCSMAALCSGGSVLEMLRREPSDGRYTVPTVTLTTTVFTVPVPSIGLSHVKFPSLGLTIPTLSLPSLPALPTRQTVYSTKTVYHETTRVSRVHPVCFTINNNLPPCINSPRPQDQSPDMNHVSYQIVDNLPNHNLYNLFPQHVLRTPITPTASVALNPQVQETQTVLNIDQSELNLDEGDREGRYLVPHPMASLDVQTDDVKPVQEPLELTEELLRQNLVERLIPPYTKIDTETVMVTKVMKVLDPMVTATLVAQNCFPVNQDIPFCESGNH